MIHKCLEKSLTLIANIFTYRERYTSELSIQIVHYFTTYLFILRVHTANGRNVYKCIVKNKRLYYRMRFHSYLHTEELHDKISLSS